MVDTLKAVIGDVKYFLAFLVLTFYSFAASFHILFRKDQKEIEVRRSAGHHPRTSMSHLGTAHIACFPASKQPSSAC